MPKFLLLLRIFNTVATALIFSAVAFLSCAFYLGDRESQQLLKEHLVESFFSRFAAFVLFGFALCLLPIITNLLVVQFTPFPFINARRFALKAAMLSIISALGGTVLFFSH